MNARIPCLIHVDSHVVVIAKPAGINTHRASSHAPLGIHEWLQLHCPELDRLSILHRLDKETSGVLVMGRTKEANRTMSAQFEERSVAKRYVLVTRGDAGEECDARESLGWSRGRAHAEPAGDEAFTRFERIRQEGDRSWYAAYPRTGRPHQIRVHASLHGIPILGDTLYGGEEASRVHLHAASLTLIPPDAEEAVTWSAEAPFDVPPAVALRRALLPVAETTCHRVLHGAADGDPALFADRLGDHLVAQTKTPLTPAQEARLETLRDALGLAGIHHRSQERHVGTAGDSDLSPRPIDGGQTPEEIIALENGLRWSLRLDSGYSNGLFGDQRTNRWRLLHNRIAPGVPIRDGGLEGARILNTFAYTCAFSVCAAKSGAHATSLDLSARWLDWGRRNFELNALDAEAHLFLKGDVLQWLPRLQRQGRRYDLVILDPPTFARMKGNRVFRAERDYAALVESAAPLVQPGGWVLASTNAQRLGPRDFEAMVKTGVESAGRTVAAHHVAPQPPDFPIHPEQQAHLKTLWVQLGPLSPGATPLP